MATKTLTDSAIKALSPGETVWDKAVAGLHVRASKTAKSFYLFFRTKAGVSRRPKLGGTRILTIAQAREIARAHLAAVSAGQDPVAEQRQSRGEPTVSVFFERCWREHWSCKKDARNVRRLYESRVAPRLGHQRVRELCYRDIAGLHSALAATPVEANRTLALLSKLLNLAERYGERNLGTNPCRHVPRYPELSRRRFATVDELARLGPLLDASWAVLPDSVAFIGLMVFTGMRPGEVEAGRREWIHDTILRLPDSKTGQRDIYLPPQALAILERLPAPPKAPDGLIPLVGVKYPRTLWERLRDAAKCPDLRLYDLRRTFATVSLAGGTSISLIGEMLGHKTAQTTKVYARLMSQAAQGVAADTGQRMQGLLGGPDKPDIG
ncbi:MAG: site-specific integrase [Deltaproteobacteria bacterium]|nr:site-specific integrase [Deltaproteobacteria bacterium]